MTVTSEKQYPKVKIRHTAIHPFHSIIIATLFPLLILIAVKALEYLLNIPTDTNSNTISLGDRMSICGVITGIVIPIALMVMGYLSAHNDEISVWSILGFTKVIALFCLITSDFVLSLAIDDLLFIVILSICSSAIIMSAYYNSISLLINADFFIRYRHKLIDSVLFGFITSTEQQRGHHLEPIGGFIANQAKDAREALKNNHPSDLSKAFNELQYIVSQCLALDNIYNMAENRSSDRKNPSLSSEVSMYVIKAISSIIAEVEETSIHQSELLHAIYLAVNHIAEDFATKKQVAIASLVYDENMHIFQSIVHSGTLAICGKSMSELATRLSNSSIDYAKASIEKIINNQGTETYAEEILLYQKVFKELFILAKNHRYRAFIKLLGNIAQLATYKSNLPLEWNIALLELTITLAFVNTKIMPKATRKAYDQILKTLFNGVDIAALEQLILSEKAAIVVNLRVEFIKTISNEAIEDRESPVDENERQIICDFLHIVAEL